jgi:hypothetical protein
MLALCKAPLARSKTGINSTHVLRVAIGRLQY